MVWVKSTKEVVADQESGIWEADVDFIEDGVGWFSRVCLYADTKKEAKQLRKTVIKALNKAEEKQNEKKVCNCPTCL